MSTKKRKSSKRHTNKRTTPKAGNSAQIQTGLNALLYAVIGGAVAYFTLPALAFKETISPGLIPLFIALCIAIGAFAGTRLFDRHCTTIAQWSFPLILVAVLANITLTYQWLNPTALISILAGPMAIITGVLWLFVLKRKTNTTFEPTGNPEYSLRKAFASTPAKIAAVAVLLISGFLIFFQLGYFDIWEDENLVINAAIGVTEEGMSYFDEGYDRARVHTLMIAGLFELFGDSEFIGRLPSAIFGIVFVLLCFLVFTRWYGYAWLAILLPLICLMNDRFLLLFRYMRMYALLIPLFLAGTYIIFRTMEIFQFTQNNTLSGREQWKKWGMPLLSLAFLLLLAHIHKLSMILLPAFGLLIVIQAGMQRTKNQLRLLYFVSGGVGLMLLLTFAVELEALKMFRQVARRIFAPHNPMEAYFEYVFNNGLPRNATLMFLVAGLGLLGANISQRLKSLLVLNYLLITIAVVSMVYLIGNTGRDYRYIAHIVPFVVATLMLTVYAMGKVIGKRAYPWGMVTILLISVLHLHKDYKRNYIKHPWSPRYSVVYNTLLDNYKPGDALIVQNVKTYYLDPEALAGEQYLKIPKRSGYNLPQFKEDVRRLGHGWVMYELHKSHHWDIEIRQYIYKKFRPYHNGHLDELGVELFYFDESMVAKTQK